MEEANRDKPNSTVPGLGIKEKNKTNELSFKNVSLRRLKRNN